MNKEESSPSRKTIPSSRELIGLLEELTDVWIRSGTLRSRLDEPPRVEQLASEIHSCNQFQWNAEARVRDMNLPPVDVVNLKRAIDDSNIRRHTLVQAVDEYYLNQVVAESDLGWDDAYLNSETIGQLIDRLSVLTLRVAFFSQPSNRVRANEGDLNLLRAQRDYVCVCYDRFVEHLIEGTGLMLPYKQLKAYSEAELTPSENDEASVRIED